MPAFLTAPQALCVVDEVLTILKKPDNMNKVMKVVNECDAMKVDPTVQATEKFHRLSPLLHEMLADLMASYGFKPEEMMIAICQMQSYASHSPSLQKKINEALQVFQGNFVAQEEKAEDSGPEACD
eukprot:GEMP01088675.1.p1 GENE.GEMP01088675.1~~GEMP01088675.1.p1  ORF type:complete len:126 (+),score=36.76 GEMP01088675.1:93-470(+)